MEYVDSQKVSVEFRMDSVQSQIQSEQAGHPVFVEKEFITIVIPGSGNTIIDTVVDDIYRKRFADAYARFKAGLTGASVAGWRLESWPAVNTAQVKTLQYMGVHTVEQLADMSDTACQSVGMGTLELRIKAKAALAAAAGGADAERIAAENKRRDDDMEALRSQIAELQAAAPRKPGRPARTEAAE